MLYGRFGIYNILRRGDFFMKIAPEMYTKLFNELTAIQEDLEKIIERSKKAQIEAEEIYISIEEEKNTHI